MNIEEAKKILKEWEEIKGYNSPVQVISMSMSKLQEAIDIVLNELELYKKTVSKMAISLGLADTDYKNMELEDIINHFLGR